MSAYLTVQEVAELARCEHKTVRRAIHAGRLTAVRTAGRLLIREEDARAWIEAVPAIQPSARTERQRHPTTRAGGGRVVAQILDLERKAAAR